MNIEQQRLKIKCPNCQKNIILTFNTTKCPKCHYDFDPDQIHQTFYNYESQLVNSKSHNAANKINTASNGMKETGSCLQNLGCIIFLIPIAILSLIFIFQLLF